MLTYIVLLLIIFYMGTSDVDGTLDDNSYSSSISLDTKFMIYDVNIGEGFNLRRDVFIRAANLINSLRSDGHDWILVLPPWLKLYHWKSKIKQNALPWVTFFDMKSLNLYVPVIDFIDYIDVTGGSSIDHVIYLQRHPDNFKNNLEFDLINKDACQQQPPYFEESPHIWRGHFWGLNQVFAKNFNCFSAQGSAATMKHILNQLSVRSVFVDRFEILMHIKYGSLDFHAARRSMVYSQNLRNHGDIFRKESLESDDSRDNTLYNADDWTKQIPIKGQAQGGPYVSVHMRRGDFSAVHRDYVPSIREISRTAKAKLQELNLSTVFLATDGKKDEIAEFERELGSGVTVRRFVPTKERLSMFYDGGIAIIDQWIAAHGRYFIGTCSSTFSLRIQEDRDILGFHPDTTYNCVCGAQADPEKCSQPTRYWAVKFS